jgi:hypothetical protein
LIRSEAVPAHPELRLLGLNDLLDVRKSLLQFFFSVLASGVAGDACGYLQVTTDLFRGRSQVIFDRPVIFRQIDRRLIIGEVRIIASK